MSDLTTIPSVRILSQEEKKKLTFLLQDFVQENIIDCESFYEYLKAKWTEEYGSEIPYEEKKLVTAICKIFQKRKDFSLRNNDHGLNIIYSFNNNEVHMYGIRLYFMSLKYPGSPYDNVWINSNGNLDKETGLEEFIFTEEIGQ